MEPYMDPRFSKKETGQMQQNGFYRDTVCDPEIKKQENWEKEDFSAPSSFSGPSHQEVYSSEENTGRDFAGTPMLHWGVFPPEPEKQQYAPGMGGYTPMPSDPKTARRKWEGKLLRRASNRVCWTLLAAALLMSTTMEILAQLLHAFGIVGNTGSSAFFLPMEFFFLAESLAYLIGLALPPYLLLKLHGIRLQEAVLTEKTPVSTAILGICFGTFICTLANFPAEWVIQWQQSMGYSGVIPSYEVTGEPAVQALYFFSVAILPPLVEEFFFRGVILRMFRRFGDGFAVVASAVLFALFHGNMAQSLFALICGLVLGFLMVKTNNIWVPIGVHFVNNGISCVWSMLAVTAGTSVANAFSSWATIAILVLGLFSLILLIFKKRRFFSLPKTEHIFVPGTRALNFLLNPGCITFLVYTAFSFLAVMLLY